MNKSIQVIKGCLIVATSAIATSVLTNSPSQAFSLSLSRSSVLVNGFSQDPLVTTTATEVQTNTVAKNDSTAVGIGQAEATFIRNPLSLPNTSSVGAMSINEYSAMIPTDADTGTQTAITPLLSFLSPLAYNRSASMAIGFGQDYLAEAQSEAAVIANFFVTSGTSFSFDFIANMNLFASTTNPTTENAVASGDIVLALLNSQTNEVLDFFAANGQVETNSNNDLLDFGASSNISIIPYSQDKNFGGNPESADFLVSGSFNRSFNQDTNLSLVEIKRNRAEVAVPEPLTTLGSLLSGLLLIFMRRYKTASVNTQKNSSKVH